MAKASANALFIRVVGGGGQLPLEISDKVMGMKIKLSMNQTAPAMETKKNAQTSPTTLAN